MCVCFWKRLDMTTIRLIRLTMLPGCLTTTFKSLTLSVHQKDVFFIFVVCYCFFFHEAAHINSLEKKLFSSFITGQRVCRVLSD